MTLRAIVVLLLVLNLGVAAWWLTRPPPPRLEAPIALDSPRLRLVGEPAAAAAARGPETTPVAVRAPLPAVGGAAVPNGDDRTPPADTPRPDGPAAAVAPVVPPVAAQCASFGPFADATAMATAQRALAALAVDGIRTRESTSSARGWRVRIANQPDRAAADALAQRIATAGFDDFLVVPAGDEANSIALGRYRGERAARQREAALRTAGFEAVTEALGDASTQRWLEFVAPAGFDVEAARRATAAPGTLRACTAGR